MDSGEEGNASPNEDIDTYPDDDNVTTPQEGEVYMPVEEMIETTEYEGETYTTETYEESTQETTETEVRTTEYEEMTTTEETTIHESRTVTSETQERYEEESYSEEYEEEMGEYEQRTEERRKTEYEEYEEERGSEEGEDYIPGPEAGVDSVSEISELTAIEIAKAAEKFEHSDEEGKTAEEEEERQVKEEVPEEPPQPEPEPEPEPEPQFKFDVVVKAQKDGMTGLDVTITRQKSHLLGFKFKGGRDLDTPPEINGVRIGGIADKAGIKLGDMIVFINDENVFGLCHHHICRAILDSGDVIKLGLLRFDDSVKSIEIKEAYKKVQVQITEEYQLVEDDPTTLGIDVQKSEHGEVAVIVKGRVLDDEEVALLQMKKTHTEIGGITTESTEVHMSKPLDAAKEVPPLPPPPPSEPPAIPPAEEKKEPANEGMVNGLEGKDEPKKKVMWVADVSTSSATAEDTAPEAGPNISPTEKAPPVEPPPPAPEVPVENKATEGELKDLSLESTTPTPPLPNLSLKGEYKPEEKQPEENAYELLIGKISWVPPPDRPINKCYFYKPKEGEKKSTKWPPKSNVSTVIVKPRVRRADEVDRSRGTTPKPTAAPASIQKSTDAPKSMPEAPQSAPQQIPTEQVSGSQPQEAAKTDSVSTSGSNETKPTEGESQVTESSEPAPQPPAGGEVVEPPKEGAAVEAPTQETPASQETPVPQETPVSQEIPAAQENSAPQENPAQQETPAPQETPTEQSADSAPPPTA